MAFDTTGNGHRTALVDEGRFTAFLNAGGHVNFDWGGDEFILARTKGGTQYTEDVVAVMKSGAGVKFSCKHAGAGIDSHSHTHKNTSKILTKLKKDGSPMVAPLTSLNDFRDGEVRRIPSASERAKHKARYKSISRTAYSQTMANLTTEVLIDFFTISMRHSLAMDYIVIFDAVERRYYWFKPEHHPAINALNESCTMALVPKRVGAASARVVLIDEADQRTDLGLRLRVKHSNGVSDLFRMGRQNSGSFVTTLQQDPGTVRKLLDTIDGQGNLRQCAFVVTA